MFKIIGVWHTRAIEKGTKFLDRTMKVTQSGQEQLDYVHATFLLSVSSTDTVLLLARP